MGCKNYFLSSFHAAYFNSAVDTSQPVCTDGKVWNTVKGYCEPPPPDADGDGTPDKCDLDHPDYSTLDCDGNGKTNGNDPDIDGDGIPNYQDPDANGYGNSMPSPTNPCLGANKGYATSTPFPISQYSFHSNLNSTDCQDLVFKDTKIDSTVWLPDLQDGCPTPYCYVHYLKNDCDFDSSWYRPGINWDYRPGLTESACGLLVDGIKYTEMRYVTPDDLKCPNTGLCYAKRKETLPDTNSTNPNTPPPNPDTNSTTADLAPLLESQNIGNDLLKGLGEKSDTTNKNLDDLKKLANDSLNTQQDSKSLLGDLKSLSESLLDGSNKANQNLGELDKTLGKFSGTSTQNQVIGNGHLSDISGKLTNTNALLTNIDSTDTLTKDLLQELRDFFIDGDDNSTENDPTLGFIEGQMGSIMTKYSISLYGSSCPSIPTFQTSVHGKNLVFMSQETINKLPVNEMRLFIIFAFTISALALAFRGN